MIKLAVQDLDRMRDSVFFDGPDVGRRLSRFWILLVLAAIIASAGVVADSTATVIGAMIVAPLMTPIMGTMLAVVIGDRANLIRSVGLVVAGSAAAVAVGFVVGLAVVYDVVAENNPQVAGRVSPGLIDLLAALATGVVGSVALVRRDISDTLPGVAIAISLVPPLTVVGLTLEAGEPEQAMGALLLFITNVAAIVATGLIVMAVYGVYRLVQHPSGDRRASRRNAFLLIAAMAVVVGVPLSGSSARIIQDTQVQIGVREAGTEWGPTVGWELVSVGAGEGKTIARFEGPTPIPPTGGLREELEARGIDPADVRVELLPRATVDFEG